MNKELNAQYELDQFTHNFQSCVIATKTENQMPYTSYAPFIKFENSYYIIISKIAKHYENFVNEGIANILFIEDEKDAQNIFFRKRLSYLVDVVLPIDNDHVKTEFTKVFGNMINMLLGMDFLIVKCIVKEGIMILGPGMAYEVDENQKIKILKRPENGHRKK